MRAIHIGNRYSTWCGRRFGTLIKGDATKMATYQNGGHTIDVVPCFDHAKGTCAKCIRNHAKDRNRR